MFYVVSAVISAVINCVSFFGSWQICVFGWVFLICHICIFSFASNATGKLVQCFTQLTVKKRNCRMTFLRHRTLHMLLFDRSICSSGHIYNVTDCLCFTMKVWKKSAAILFTARFFSPPQPRQCWKSGESAGTKLQHFMWGLREKVRA